MHTFKVCKKEYEKRIEHFLYNDSYCSKTKTFFSLTKPVEQVWFTAGTFRWRI